MTKRIADLTGPDLDRAVANAHGMMLYHEDWQPSRNWEQGGPIIEQEGIGTFQTWDGVWMAAMTGPAKFADFKFPSATPLEAAMRCFVASKFGEEVPDADQA